MLSQKHSITLHGLEQSVYTRIARLALEEKRVEYNLQVMDVFTESAERDAYLGINPFGHIPTLVHDSYTVYETSAITRYIDEAFTGVALQPKRAQDRAIMNQVIGIIDSYAYQPMVWGVFVQTVVVPSEGGSCDPKIVLESLNESAVCLKALSGLLGTKPFFASDSLSLADLHVYPVVRYLNLTAEGKTLFQDYPQMVSWYNTMNNRPSVFNTLNGNNASISSSD